MKRSPKAEQRSRAASERLTPKASVPEKKRSKWRENKLQISPRITPDVLERQRSHDPSEDYTKKKLLHSGFQPAKTEATADWCPPVHLKINRCFEFRDM